MIFAPLSLIKLLSQPRIIEKRMNLPEAFASYMKDLLGEAEYDKLETALSEEPPVSIRLNPRKPIGANVSCDKVAWSAHGIYLNERPTFTFDPLFHAGCYYVQEASSMFVERALKEYTDGTPVKMLDLCAAPGGKSTHALSVLPEGSLLVSNEVIRNRAQILAENITKWGYSNTVVTNNDPADFAKLPSFFDIILTDVPCSGEGMFRKDNTAINEWSENNVEICWQRQRRIIRDIWQSLKPGGTLIYSTCTFNTKEDEENVSWIVDEFNAEVLPIKTDPTWNITGNLMEGSNLPVYHFIPGHTRGEGFFLALLRKADDSDDEYEASDTKSGKRGKKKQTNAKGNASSVSKAQMTNAKGWLKSDAGLSVVTEDNFIRALPNEHINDIEQLRQNLKVMQAGVEIGEVKGNDVIPSHALAMSDAMSDEAFERYDICYEQAIAYLRKEAITLPDNVRRGYVLLTYRGIPLGFVKNVGNRANNMYPQEWRIRSGYLPEDIKLITTI